MIRFNSLLLASLLSLLASASSAAAQPTLFGQPVAQQPESTERERQERRQEFEAMLTEKGLEVHGDVIGPPELFAAPSPQPAPAEWSYPPHRATIFLNFFGGEMSYGTNSALMESTCLSSKIDYPGFSGTEAQALAIIETFESLLAPYGVRVAYDKAPPPELPYAMVMMGGKPDLVGLQNGVLGVSCSSDCGDRWWRDTTFAFTAAASPNQSNTLSTTALHEAAHAFGLAHIDTANNSPYVMHPFVDNSEKVWGEQCEDYNPATGGINCQSTHDVWCGGGAQNTHAELMAYFGPNGPDIEPPIVTILAPEDGLELDPGGNVQLETTVTDNYDGVGWKLMIYKDDVLVQDEPTFNFQTKWSLTGLPKGVLRLRVQAIDHDRNVGADEVTLYVGVPAPSMGTSTGSETSDAETGAVPTEAMGATGDTTTGGGSSSTTSTDQTGGDDGCSCITGERRSTAWLVLLAPLIRRRRSATRRGCRP